MKKRMVFANLLLILICVFVGCGKTEGNNGNNKFSVEDKIDYSEVKPLIADSAVVKSLLEQYEMNSVDVNIKDSKNEGDSTKLKVDLILSSEYVSCGVSMIAEISKWNSGWSLDNLYKDGNGQTVFTPIKFPQNLVINITTHHGEDAHYSFSLHRTVNSRNKTNLFCSSSFDTEEFSTGNVNILNYTQDYKSVNIEFELNYSHKAYSNSFCIPATAEFDSNKGIWVIDYYMEDDYYPNSSISLDKDYILENWTDINNDSGNFDRVEDVSFNENEMFLRIIYDDMNGQYDYKTVGYNVSCEGGHNSIGYDDGYGEYVVYEGPDRITFVPKDASEPKFSMDDEARLSEGG